MHYLSFIGFLLLGLPISLLPYPAVHFLGKHLGTLMYYLHRSFRKKALTNLSIAKTLYLTDSQKKKIAKESFQTLMINCLEYFRLKRSKNRMEELASWGVPREEGLKSLREGKGMVFLTGHQANWEVPFLLMTQYHEGIAIGKPIKNKWLYKWILSIREMHKGKIVTPKRALSIGYQGLKEGKFLGIVGDQALPESPYSYPLFGMRAWTTTAPALLAYRTGCPLVTVMSMRYRHRYYIWGSPLLWPDLSKPIKEEVPRLMDQAMGYLEESIKACPGQWLWQHDRWKQSGVDHIKRKYRYAFILVIFPKDPTPYLSLIPILYKLYPRNFFFFYVPKEHVSAFENLQPDTEILPYSEEKELFCKDYRFQMVFDFYDSHALRSHFLKLGAFQALNTRALYKIAKKELGMIPSDLATALKYTICKPDCVPKIFKRESDA